MRTHLSRVASFLWSLGLVGGLSSCSESTGLNDIDVDLPSRTGPVDTTGVTAALRSTGGNVFVATAEPTDKALEVLGRAGLAPPVLPDHPTEIVTFPALQIKTVAGHVGAGGVRAIAELRFVTRVEASGGDIIHANIPFLRPSGRVTTGSRPWARISPPPNP
jgi:hypothetical protein